MFSTMKCGCPFWASTNGPQATLAAGCTQPLYCNIYVTLNRVLVEYGFELQPSLQQVLRRLYPGTFHASWGDLRAAYPSEWMNVFIRRRTRPMGSSEAGCSIFRGDRTDAPADPAGCGAIGGLYARNLRGSNGDRSGYPVLQGRLRRFGCEAGDLVRRRRKAIRWWLRNTLGCPAGR